MGLTQHPIVERAVEGEVVSGKKVGCPFYGMSLVMGVLMDTHGNQCALKTGNHSPCHMEMRKEVPDWNTCEYRANEKNDKFVEFMGKSRAFPEKFRPYGASSWEGISMAAWFEHVMGRKSQ